MGWWRSLLPCGKSSCKSAVATFCCCCCGRGKDGMHDEEPEDASPENAEQKSYVFLENYPTEQKIKNPLVPFLGELPVSLYSGRMIVIEGIIKPRAIRMSVNLACGSGPKSDLAFHLNPRFEQNLVVRNCRIENRWGIEETSSVQHFPFKRGHNFQMQIFTTEDNFMVAFNGEHFCSFAYRVPLIRVKTIQVNGDVDITELEYKTADVYPLPYEGVMKLQYNITSNKALCQIVRGQVDPPITACLEHGFLVGSEIEIMGRVKLLPHSFYINLQAGTHIWPHPLVALHINPRFKSGGGVIQNAWVKGKWGAEKKTEIRQFRAGRPFSIKIASEDERYAVSVDGSPPVYFPHRCSPSIINAVYIQGDIFVKDIRYTRFNGNPLASQTELPFISDTDTDIEFEHPHVSGDEEKKEPSTRTKVTFKEEETKSAGEIAENSKKSQNTQKSKTSSNDEDPAGRNIVEKSEKPSVDKDAGDSEGIGKSESAQGSAKPEIAENPTKPGIADNSGTPGDVQKSERPGDTTDNEGGKDPQDSEATRIVPITDNTEIVQDSKKTHTADSARNIESGES